MITNKILLISLCLLVTSCSFRKDEAKQHEAAKATSEVLTEFQRTQEEKKQTEEEGGRLTDQNVHVTFTENPEPSSYQMRITWPASVVTMEVQINDSFDLITSKDGYVEVGAQSDFEYRVRLFSKNTSGIEVSRKEIKVRSPRDIILRENQEFFQNTTLTANRIYFSPNSKIITHGYNLQINANKIFVHEDKSYIPSGTFWRDAHIATAILNEEAHDSLQLKGGEISINAKHAEGHLKVAMVGLNGKNGRNGDELDRDQGLVRFINPALQGASGINGSVIRESVPCTTRKGLDTPCERVVPRCQVAPGNGADGLPGLPGTPGEVGQNGGSTGSFFIRVDEASKFSVELGQLPGKPGLGGIGGPGSPGGLGGKAGTHPGSPCPVAQDGRQGPQGPQGANGKTGEDGRLGTVDTGPVRTTVFPL